MTPREQTEWFDAIPTWSPAQRATAHAAAWLFGGLIGVVLLVRLVAPAPPAVPAPAPSWSWADFTSGESMRQLDRHWKETSWFAVALRAVHDEVLRVTGLPQPTGALGQFCYQTADGELFEPSQFLEMIRRGYVVPVPGAVGSELPRPRLMIAPNQTFYLCYRDNDRLQRDWFDAQSRVLVRLDSLGLRERPELTGAPKPPGQRRVLCLGDSLTFGWGVPEQLGWVRQLETALRDDGGDVRTINCGAAGTVCVDEYAAALSARFAALAPDAVIVGLCLNDLIPSSGLSFLGPAAAQRSFADAISGAQRRTPLDLDPAQDWVGQLLQLPRDQGLAAGLYGDDKPFEAMWSQGTPQRCLRQMKAWCDERKLPFLVVLWPFLQGLGPGRHYPFTKLHELVAADCREAGIALVDLLPVFRDEPQDDLWVTPADMHPNPRAHRLATPPIADALRAIWRR